MLVDTLNEYFDIHKNKNPEIQLNGCPECFGVAEKNKQCIRSRDSKRKVKYFYTHNYSDGGREQKGHSHT